MITTESISNPVLVGLGVIFGILILASIVTKWMAVKQLDKDHTELCQRVRSWWVIVVLFAIAVILQRAYSLVFFGFVSFLALKEFFSVIPTRRADRRVLFWAYLAIPIQYYWVSLEWYGMFIIWIPVFMFLFLPMRMVLIGKTDGFLRSVGTIHWGLMTTVFSISHLAYLLIEDIRETPAQGAGLLLFIVALTQFNDVAQYLWGKSIGRHKVVPMVSPNKTVEGLAGGVLTTATISYFVAPYLTPLAGLEAIGVGAGIGLVGFMGDVVISAIKRDLGIKDTGSILPGHGGILDRIDSLMFTAPLFFHYLRYYY
ncbi:MAG: phosphatidate cytidylyltransferase [Planctomycetota bacterium]|jgi:phosphatidate cytidylyltransferase